MLKVTDGSSYSDILMHGFFLSRLKQTILMWDVQLIHADSVSESNPLFTWSRLSVPVWGFKWSKHKSASLKAAMLTECWAACTTMASSSARMDHEITITLISGSSASSIKWIQPEMKELPMVCALLFRLLKWRRNTIGKINTMIYNWTLTWQEVPRREDNKLEIFIYCGRKSKYPEWSHKAPQEEDATSMQNKVSRGCKPRTF